MVMADRPDVRTASTPIAAVDTVGLAQQMVNALIRVPFRQPWRGSSSLAHNLGQNVTREVIRTFMGYASSLPIEEFRSIEALLDRLSDVALSPVVALRGVSTETTTIASVPGIWYRPKGVEKDGAEPVGRVLYLHGGGYVGTSPHMYAAFTAQIAATTRCEVFVADYRLAPEFPFPAGLEDALAILGEWTSFSGPVLVAGDSGGGGLATSVVATRGPKVRRKRGRVPADIVDGLILFSPEVDLELDEPSVTENADRDILPWNIPTSAYLHGTSAEDGVVSAVEVDVTGWPPVYVCWGSDEMFRDPIRLFAEHLTSAHVPTVAEEYPGMFHVFPILMPWADAARSVFASVDGFVGSLLAASAQDEASTTVPG